MRLTLAMSALAGGLVLGWGAFAEADTAAGNAPPPAAPIFYCPTPNATATPAPTPAKTSPTPARHAVHHVRYVHPHHQGCPTERHVTVASNGGEGWGGERHHHHDGWRHEDEHAASFVNDDVSKSQAFIYRYERIHHGLEALAAREAWRDAGPPPMVDREGPPPGPMVDQEGPPPPPTMEQEGPPVLVERLPPPDAHRWRDHDGQDGDRDADRDARAADAYAREDAQDGWVDDGHHGPAPEAHLVRRYDAYAAEHARDGHVEIQVDGHDGHDRHTDRAYGYGDRQVDGHVAAYGFERRDVERDGVDRSSGYAYSDRDGVRHEQHYGDDGRWVDDHHWVDGHRPPPCPPPHDIGCTAGQDPGQQASDAHQGGDGQWRDNSYGATYAVSGRDAQGYLVWPGKTPQ